MPAAGENRLGLNGGGKRARAVLLLNNCPAMGKQ
jgi:hypothetical protein